jgi:hypothetical protein
MTNVKMKATDQLHISAVKADSLQPGEEFEVSTALADDLIARGLPVERVKAKAEPVAPENKMEAAPANKAAKPRAKKRGK